MKRPRLRTTLATAAFLIIIGAVWWYFAPAAVGGSTRYVVTSGTSMEPRFRTGDLAVVRPSGQYKAGDVVAYWSTLLHTVVLHRIYAIDGNRYVFKGDNNHFLDPVHPTRHELLGKLWLHVPRGGKWLGLLHSPVGVAIIIGLLGATFIVGFAEQERRRRKRRRKSPPGSLRPGKPLVNSSPDPSVRRRIDFGAFLTASAIAAAVFVVLGLIAFTRPARSPSADITRYTQTVRFGYSAQAQAGPVYPTGAVNTGDPIFLSLVHQLGVRVDYGFVSTATHNVVGTEEILLQLSSPTGWNRSLVLTPPTRFTGDQTGTVVHLDMPQLARLLNKVGRLTGMLGGSYTIAVVPTIHITGTVAGHPLNVRFAPAMNFQLGPTQLMPQGAVNAASVSTAGSSTAPGNSPTALTATRSGTVGTPGTAPATITVLGVSPEIALLRWIAILGLLISGAAAGFFYLRKRAEPFQETAHIQSQYGHMIVPIVAGEDLGWPAVDVPTMKGLVKLAESGQRLILHSRAAGVDTYMVNDEGTVYRYQVKPSKVVWGEWSAPAADLQEAASEIARVAAEATPSVSSAT